MAPEALTPANTTVVLIDFGLGFGNVFRSHPVLEHQNNALLLADLALGFQSGLVVTNGPSHKASGPYYPRLLDLLGDHPIIERGGMFNAFLFDRFKQAVREADRPNVVVAGLVTEGCVLQTVLGGMREGYRMHVNIDASAGATREIHEAAIQRMIQAGVVPVSTFSLAAEFVVDQSVAPGAKTFMELTQKYQPEMANMGAYFDWAQQDARQSAKP